MSIIFMSCEKDTPEQVDNNSNNENNQQEVEQFFIAGNTDIDNYYELDSAILIVIDCIEEEYYSCLKKLDLMQDGYFDFGFHFEGSPLGYWMEVRFHSLQGYQILCNDNNHLKRLVLEDTITSDLNWQDGDDFLMLYSNPDEYIGEMWFADGEDSFIAFRTIQNNDTVMGWFRLYKTTYQIGNAIHTAYKIPEYGLSQNLVE
jgi:hypothetical protein